MKSKEFDSHIVKVSLPNSLVPPLDPPMQRVADPRFPSDGVNRRRGRQPIIWYTFFRKLPENERNWTETSARIISTLSLRMILLFSASFIDYVAILISKHETIILRHKTVFVIKYQSVKRDLQSFKFCKPNKTNFP